MQDPTEPAEPTASGERAAPGRRVLPWLVAGVALVLAASALVVAVANRQRAEDWRVRADARAETIADLEAEIAAANDEVASLEARLDELANELAGTQDEREAAIVTADQLEELVRQAGLVATDLDTCARGAVEVVDLVNQLGDFDLDEVNTYVLDVQEVCARALGENEALQAAIDSIDVEGGA
jgi:chromosome segregation ATPase